MSYVDVASSSRHLLIRHASGLPLGGGGAVAPVNTVLPAITGTPTVGQTLTTSNGSWTGSPTPTFTFQWKNAGANISGATSSTYVLQASDEGDLITVTVTGTNASGAASATSASVGPIAAALTAPVNTVLPAISGTTTVGQTLTASTGTWTGNPTPTYAYQWKNAGVDIGGATSSTYVLQTSDESDLITVTVTATNSQGAVAATSASVGPVGPYVAVGGEALITAETNAFAADFDYATDANRAAKRVSSVTTEYGLNSFFSNASTSPKMVCSVGGTLGWAPHNMFLNSASPATQSVTTVVGRIYTVTVTGSGTLTGSAGASGAATAGAPLTFTASTTTSTFTLSGSLTTIQMNRGSVATAHLTTTGSIRYGLDADYDPVSHAARGMLVEIAATNFVPASTPVTSTWTARGTAALTQGQTGPTGEATAALVAGIGNPSTNDLYVLCSGMGNSAVIEPSFFIKKVSTTGTLRLQNAYYPTGDGQWDINLATLGSGWERITRAHAAVTINNSWTADNTGAAGPHFYAVAGAPLSFHLAFVQLEVGTFATSPVPTIGVTVTRAADDYSFSLSSIPSLGSDYSIYARFSTPTITNARHVFVVTNGTTNEYAGFLANTTARLAVIDGGSAVGAITRGSLTANTSSSAAARIKANDCAMSLDGAAVGTDATVTLPTVTEVRFGNVGSNAVTTGNFQLHKMAIVMPGWSDATLVIKSGS